MGDIRDIFPDAKMPTEWQRQKLCEMMCNAFIELRDLGWQDKSEQAADLADAFHNLPSMLWSNNLSLAWFRKYLESYDHKYQNGRSENYLKMLDKIINEENL